MTSSCFKLIFSNIAQYVKECIFQNKNIFIIFLMECLISLNLFILEFNFDIYHYLDNNEKSVFLLFWRHQVKTFFLFASELK